MPDDYNNVGSAAPAASSTREVRLKINHGDPDLTVTEQGTLVASAPEAAATPTATRPTLQPLKENAAPFNVPEVRVPATEYVRIDPQPIPRPVPHPVQRPIPRPQPLFQPVPQPPAQPRAQAIPAPQQFAMGQSIGPIIRTRPPVGRPMKVLQPFSEPLVALATASPTEMPTAIPPPPAPAPVLAPPHQIEPAPAAPLPGSTIAGQPVAVEAVPEVPQAPAVNMNGTVMVPAAVDYSKPLMAYSDNTRAVWHVRRSGKTLLIVFSIGLVFVLFGLFIYWKSIGSPTSIKDIPLLRLR